jgi:hypothetical protein
MAQSPSGRGAARALDAMADKANANIAIATGVFM